MLQSFGVLDGDKVSTKNSKYAAYYIGKLKELPPQGVINYSDIFEEKFMGQYVDKRFKLSFIFAPIIFLSMVYDGYAVMTLKNGKALTASNLDEVPKTSVLDLYEFKYLSRPSEMAMAELKTLFNVLDINPAQCLRLSRSGAYHPISVFRADGRRMLMQLLSGSTQDGNAMRRILPELRPGDPVLVGMLGADGRSLASGYGGAELCPEYLIHPDGGITAC